MPAMSLARSIVSFCIDISPSMGAKRKVKEQVTQASVGLDEQQQCGPTIRERETTDLQWVNEFVAKKVQSYILSGLKTAKVHILLFGSPRTNNTLLETTKIKDGYLGIDEVFKPDQPTMSTLELLRCLRAAKEEEQPHRADPLDALVAAITTLNNKEASGSTNVWKRTIYLITDGKTVINTSDKKVIQDRLIEDNITLKVIGVDFDDPDVGFKEESKSAVKAENEAWWQAFLAPLPNSGLATAAQVIAQSSLPSIHLQSSAPFATSLTFGDPEDRLQDSSVLDIPIKMYKATAVARPMSQKKLSKVAQQSAAAQSQAARVSHEFSQYRPSSTPSIPERRPTADEGENGLTYMVQMQKKYFIKDDLEMVEGGIEEAEPLAEGEESMLDKAYKLGATLVAINEELERPMDTRAGMEIIHFIKQESYRRHFHMGETWYVFASDGNYKAQLLLSGLIQAMARQGKYAVVRLVRRNGLEPKIGILAPMAKSDDEGQPYEGMCFVEAPFREDLKRFTFPPLDRVVNREGKELEEHASLPSKEMQSCMDDLVDGMDLMDAVQDEEGNGSAWFKCVESFNPAIHMTKEAVSWRVFHPEDKSLPQPHQEVVKYLEMPEKVAGRSEMLGKRCREVFGLGAYYPIDKKKDAKRQALERARERGDEDADREKKELNLEGALDEELAEEAMRTPLQLDDGSDTEEEEEEEARAKEGKEAGGSTQEDALATFESNLADPARQVEDVIDSMGEAITAMVTTSFASNGYSAARDMIKAMRKGSIEYEEAARFNDFLRSLKRHVLDDALARSRADFWDIYVRGREDLGLITNEEAIGEATGVDKGAAMEFVNL